MQRTPADKRTFGTVLLERFGSDDVPVALRSAARELARVNARLHAAMEASRRARRASDDARMTVVERDGALEHAVEALADAVVAAGMGTRLSPFRAFSRLSPSRIVDLDVRREVRVVRALCAAIGRAHPSTPVARALVQCVHAADRLESAVHATIAPDLALESAIEVRKQVVTEWRRVLLRLKRQARAAFGHDRKRALALFAGEPSLHAVHRRSRRLRARHRDGGRAHVAAA